MKSLTFLGPSHRLILPDKTILERGESSEVSDELAADIRRSNPRVSLEITDVPKSKGTEQLSDSTKNEKE